MESNRTLQKQFSQFECDLILKSLKSDNWNGQKYGKPNIAGLWTKSKFLL